MYMLTLSTYSKLLLPPDKKEEVSAGLFGDNSEWEPPDSISNSEVKPLSADDSVGFPM